MQRPKKRGLFDNNLRQGVILNVPLPHLKEPKQEEDNSDADSQGDDDGENKSKKKRKLEARLKIADLKQACPRPEVVEVWDVTAQDPKLLVYLKATFPIPNNNDFPDKLLAWLYQCNGGRGELGRTSARFHTSSPDHNVARVTVGI